MLSFVTSVATGYEDWPCSLQFVLLCPFLPLRVVPHPGSGPAPLPFSSSGRPWPGEPRAGREDTRPRRVLCPSAGTLRSGSLPFAIP